METFGERLNALFANVHPRGRGPHTLQEVADAINAGGIDKTSPSYLSALRLGQRTNPSKATIEALADFFKVDPSYFFDTEYYEEVRKDLETLAKLRDQDAQELFARAYDLSPEDRSFVNTVIDKIQNPGGEGKPRSSNEAKGKAGD